MQISCPFVNNMALFQNNLELNQIADHIFILLDYKTLSNLEKVNPIWSRHFSDPKLWLRLCMKKEAKWFKDINEDSNQSFATYKRSNLQWYQLLEGLGNSQDQDLKKSLLPHLKLRFKTTFKLIGAFTSIHITPFAFAAKCGNLELAKYIISNTDPFKKMKHSAMIHVDQGEVLNDEVVPFDPTLIPIHTAARFGQVEVVKFLMETYSHLNEAIDEFNLTPIEHAINKGHRKVLKVLLSFPIRDDIKSRAYTLAMDKQWYAMAFEIDKWNTVRVVFIDALESIVGNCYFALTTLAVIAFIFLIWAFIILYMSGWFKLFLEYLREK